MTDEQRGVEDRVLVLAPGGKDAALTCSILNEALIACTPCVDAFRLARGIEEGAGAVVLVEEALSHGEGQILSDALRKQPPWSDLPVLVLTQPGADSATVSEALQTLGNVTLIERPTRVAALVSSVRTALRSRQRQYELRDRMEELHRSERNLADFFENAAVGLHIVGADGIILRANQTELQLLGYEAHEYVGHHVAEFHADFSAGIDMLQRLLGGDSLDNFEAQLRAKDGSIRHVLISSNVLWENGRFVHTRCFTRDITHRKRAEDALRDADRRKDEFLATLAHELRNPLAPICNSLQILRLSGTAAPVPKHLLEMMERQVDHMVRLVDDLMEMSRITRGSIELRKEPIALAEVILSAVETSRPLIESAGHQLTVDLPAEPLILNADFVRLSQVFANLLNNAAKYTDAGGRIELSARRQRDEVVVSIKDNGIGIPPDMLRRVFDMFAQVDRAAGRAQGGLGIGLTLVRSLIEMHGGRVEARSPGPGSGSEFRVTLPAALEAETPARQPASESARGPSLGRVLVVDDNRDAANSLATLLRLLGAQVEVSYDGPTALETLATFKPAVVLLDIGMPVMDGFEVARRIRRDPEHGDVILIAMTGWSQEQDRERTQAAGFHHHLIKPADVGALRSLLIDSIAAKNAGTTAPRQRNPR